MLPSSISPCQTVQMPIPTHWYPDTHLTATLFLSVPSGSESVKDVQEDSCGWSKTNFAIIISIMLHPVPKAIQLVEKYIGHGEKR